MKNKLKLIILATLCLFIIEPELTFAAPGGIIAKGFFKTFIGKTLLILFFIIFLPIIIYIDIKTDIANKKNIQLVKKISLYHENFTWEIIDRSIKEIFKKVNIAWNNQDLTQVYNIVDLKFIEQQNSTFINEWKSKKVKNICNVSKINNTKLLLLEIINDKTLDQTRITIEINAKIEDYILDLKTQKIIKGKKGYSNESYIWTFQYKNNTWILVNISPISESLQYINTKNIIPKKYLT